MLYPTLKLLHLLSVVVLTAGTALGATTSIMARKTSKTRELAIIGQFARRVPVMTGAGSLLAMITGTLLVWAVGFGFGTPWVIAAYVTWLLAVILSGAVLGRKMAAAGPHLAKAIETRAEEAPEFQKAFDDPTFKMTQRILEGLILVFFFLMIFKPGI
jgi:uncharacterized membrane protein